MRLGVPMDDKAMAVYRELLVEIKYRTEALDEILGKRVPLRAKIAEELCYLQLRMICEIIAIGCLVINAEIGAKKSALFKTYKADWIMREMGKLHSRFYPIPLEKEDDTSQGGPPAWIHKKDGFLTQRDLATLWAKCGDQLHRGKAKNVLEPDKELSFDKLQVWRNRIVNLLNRHIITSPDQKHVCYFIMNDGQDRVFSCLFQQISE